MATTKTYFISPGGNTIVTGQDLILDGAQQFHTDGTAKLVPTGRHKTIIINSASSDSWMSGDDFEINNLATNNTLNATLGFNGGSPGEVNPAAFSGIQLVNITLGEHDVTVDGGGGSNVLPLFSGIQALTLKSSAGGFLTFGSSSNPLTVLLTQIDANNATASGTGISVNVDPTSITPTTAVTFNFTNVGNGPGNFTADSDDYVHGSGNVFAAGWGANDGSKTAATWNLSVTGKTFIELFTHGATNTTTVNVSGAGSMTLFGVSDEFGNVSTIKDTASGAQVITGALQTDGAFKDYTGFLADNTVLTNGGSLTVTSTNTGNFVDLSGFESLGTATISVAAGTVVLDDDVLLGGTPIVIGTPTNIGYGGDDGVGPGSDGTIDMSFLPSSVNSLTFYHGVFDNSGSLSIINTKGTFTVNLQDEDFHENNFNIAAASPAQANTLTIDVGNPVTNQVATGLEEHWNVTGYGTVNIVLAGDDRVDIADDFSSGGFVANSTLGPATINIGGALENTNSGTIFLIMGNPSSVTPSEFATFGSIASEAAAGVTTFAGSIVDTAKAFFSLGATDAILVDASKGDGLFMGDPDTNIGSTFVAIGSNGVENGVENQLQSTFGLSDGENNNGGEFGFAGPATLTGGNGNIDAIFDVGGAVTVNVHNTHTEIAYSQFQLNFGSGQDFAFAITNDAGNFTNNFNGTTSLGPGLLVVNGFTPGDNGASNFLDFNTNSWAHAGGFYQGLVNGSGSEILLQGDHFADFSIVTTTGGLFNTDVLAYEIGGPFGSAAAVAKALVSAGGFVDFGGGFITGGHFDDFLVAYTNTKGGISIADIQLAPVDSGDTEGAAIRNAFDLVQLNKVAIGSIVGTTLGSNDVIHFNFF